MIGVNQILYEVYFLIWRGYPFIGITFRFSQKNIFSQKICGLYICIFRKTNLAAIWIDIKIVLKNPIYIDR